MSVTTRAPM